MNRSASPEGGGSRDVSTATFGGGCFWCLEAAFEQLAGVDKVVSGYAGGDSSEPTYEEVCSGESGHAEVVQITFDPSVIAFADLLEVFFKIHDPTTLNRQGGDVGTQYRSIILTQDESQAKQARAFIEVLEESGLWGAPVVTEVRSMDRFHAAESYHQDFFRNNPTKGYCLLVVAPKVEKVREAFADRLKR